MGKPIAYADQPVIQQGKVKQTRDGKKDQAGKDHPFRIPNKDFPGFHSGVGRNGDDRRGQSRNKREEHDEKGPNALRPNNLGFRLSGNEIVTGFLAFRDHGARDVFSQLGRTQNVKSVPGSQGAFGKFSPVSRMRNGIQGTLSIIQRIGRSATA